MLGTHKYTLAGCLAILMWSTIVAFIRNVAEQLGPVGGAAMIYTVSTALLAIFIGLPRPGRFSPKYLLVGGALFVSYEMCLALALGMANDRHQTVEMGVINYLWPCLTVLLAVMVSKKRVSLLLYPALALAFLGVAWTVSGDEGLSLSQIAANVATNPVSYTLAFVGAFIWAVYCNVTKRLANGENAITWFFMATALALWAKYFMSDEPAMVWSMGAVTDLLFAAVAMGAGYALWNIGIIGGNMMLLATLSYFTPIFSTFFAAVLLDIELTTAFWQGVIMVTLASLACWWLTRKT
ncbi:drug/metabolite DMT transporter permease [Photobacterium ganghwense]|uniref:Aromatic amino acid exporter n=1 Tax=Photobacterium ganghwense TaxID=320778 RepID=A0A0J1KAZ4_9GAMM|nr:aromatic amino acid DMT transporter YddG [Photobacterium ganghwense]KLV11492.1 aromatic amino acid exporter [Photobacterium ganghwense]PSU08349.1 drug/metabolite DMT transporter permease [Photobacterium ganghwense]QSV15155.1 aromatic amino acid DMT transporter YddG [Photobacterium ganghwense]